MKAILRGRNYYLLRVSFGELKNIEIHNVKNLCSPDKVVKLSGAGMAETQSTDELRCSRQSCTRIRLCDAYLKIWVE